MRLRISELCDTLEQDVYNEIQPIGLDEISTSSERIKKIALGKLAYQNIKVESEKVGKLIKRKSVRALLIAAIVICLSCATVFALNNSIFFRQIFGDDISTIENSIQSPRVVVHDSKIKMSIESILSDGYVSYLVVSLEKLNGDKFTIDEKPRFAIHEEPIMKGSSLSKYGTKELKNNIEGGSKKYYSIIASSDTKIIDNNISIEFKGMYKYDDKFGEECTLKSSLSVNINHTDNKNCKYAVIESPQKDSKYYFTEVYISPIGLVIKGKENTVTPEPLMYRIQIKFNNGNTEKISYNSQSGDSMSGSVHRDSGTFSYLFEFNKLKDINEIKSILLNNKEYLFK
ncbi:MAG: hypothetical protein ACYDG2_18180 [Ruminiclostridium sp.]